MPSLSEKKYSNSSFYITKSSESNEERAKVHIHSLPIYGQTVNHIGNRFFFVFCFAIEFKYTRMHSTVTSTFFAIHG